MPRHETGDPSRRASLVVLETGLVFVFVLDVVVVVVVVGVAVLALMISVLVVVLVCTCMGMILIHWVSLRTRNSWTRPTLSPRPSESQGPTSRCEVLTHMTTGLEHDRSWRALASRQPPPHPARAAGRPLWPRRGVEGCQRWAAVVRRADQAPEGLEPPAFTRDEVVRAVYVSACDGLGRAAR